ncbi:MAG TPA: hypothetical protein PK777_03875 [Thermoguttaceae bacterium]|nr:hypothetical protein [Thermoguttaceae bacterium]
MCRTFLANPTGRAVRNIRRGGVWAAAILAGLLLAGWERPGCWTLCEEGIGRQAGPSNSAALVQDRTPEPEKGVGSADSGDLHQAVPIGGELARLVEADWAEQDRLFARSGGLLAQLYPQPEKPFHLPEKICRQVWAALFPGNSVSTETPPKPLEEFSLEHIRHVLERAEGLAARLQGQTPPKELERRTAEIQRLQGRLTQLEKRRQSQANAPSVSERRELYLQARRVLRGLAWTNPLLQKIEKLLFIKRHDPAGVFHMCDQFYGCNAVPGGGLFVLEEPFGPTPRLKNLLENSVVENGRLRGKKLQGGSFLSPEVSYDGQTILFAYSEAAAYQSMKGRECYLWGPEISYHIFRCQSDGAGLRQLTDGNEDDFDPCFLPNGRIVFVSKRRGGYLRCGRHCPVYTLFSMEPDGSDLVCLSFHETHEWQPSVTNDGMIVYTRWDYVDRDTNVAHHIWLCYPDGRDPRSYHGNYPVRREGRPWMEMDIRAIPGSHRFVAVTGAHHGHAFGSLVLVDQRGEDDGLLSQLERLTPETPFPEAEARPIRPAMVYGTPWPLSEEDYLCVYDPAAKNRGIYWIDRYGNKELIYRDPASSCVSPMPLAPRPRPPVIPAATIQTARSRTAAVGGSNAAASPGRSIVPPSTESKSSAGPEADWVNVRRIENSPPTDGTPALAEVAVMNVYDSDFAWPQGVKIRALRVIQLLPKSTPPPNTPRIGVANQTNARMVLGVVPVEEDGSAYFLVPHSVPIYFQALDGEGMAVQSMRSVTYLHPGERLVCQGCHEPKHRAPSIQRPPLALSRPPSRWQPEPDGSRPFNYVQLVQPVLDRHCVGCHQEKKALDVSGHLDRNGFTRSYNNLAGRYGFYYHVGNGSLADPQHGGSRSRAGQFGARASALLPYLRETHYGVKLSSEELRRITLWLDCNSEFVGAYEEPGLQAQGKPVWPSLQ